MSKALDLIKDMKILLESTDMSPLQKQSDNLIGRAIELFAQPKQEPVAWRKDHDGHGYSFRIYDNGGEPLYTQQKREPLSDEEILNLYQDFSKTTLLGYKKMNKERELLKRVRDTQHTLSVQIAYEIEEMLAKPEQPEQPEQEPVAWDVVDANTGESTLLRYEPLYRVHKKTPLYASPPKREPIRRGRLTATEIGRELKLTGRSLSVSVFEAGVAFAEKAHGITGETE